MKKSVKLFFCVIMTVIFAVFGVACEKGGTTDKKDGDLSKEPIIGTWFCNKRSEDVEYGADVGYVYYVVIKPSENEKKKDCLSFYVNWISSSDIHHEKADVHEANHPHDMRRVVTREDVDYTVFCSFRSQLENKDYYVTMNGNDEFVAVLKENKSEPRYGTLTFKRTDMTWEQCKAAYTY